MRDHILKKIAASVIKYPWKILIVTLLLVTASVSISSKYLELHTDQDDLISEKLEYHKRYKDFLREFGDQEYLYVVTEVNDDLPRAKAFVRALAGRLESISDIKQVTYKISNPALERSFLLYLSKSQLNQINAFLGSGPTSVQNVSKWNSISSVLATMNELMSGPQPEARQDEMKSGFEFLNELVDGMYSTVVTGKMREPKIAGAFLGSDQTFDEEGYLLTPNGKLLFILIMPEKRYDTLSVIEKPLEKIRSAITLTKKEFPDINAGLTGRPVLQADEMSITNRDMTRGTILAIVGVTLLFILYFRRLTRPLMAITSLLFGICLTFGLTTLAIGYLNLLSSVFALTLVGAGIEFGLQIVSRYREELDATKDPKQAVRTCIVRTGHGNITAAATTAAAFFTALLTDFKALAELGFIAGIGIILCLGCLIVVLPTMMYLKDRGRHHEGFKTQLLVDLRGIEHLYKKPRLIIGVLVALTILGLPGLMKLKFDHNLLNLQAEGLESVKFEKLIIEKSGESTWYAVAITKTEAEARQIADNMRQKDTVGKIETVENIVPSDQKEKMELVAKLKEAFWHLNFSTIETRIDKRELLGNLKTMIKNMNRLTEMAFGSGYVEAVEELERLSKKLNATYVGLQNADPAKINELAKYQGLLITKFREGISMLKDGLNPTTIVLSDISESVRNKYVSKNGNYATIVYPKYDVWEPGKMKDFVQEIRSVDPSIVGTPIEVFESSRLLQVSFQKVALYALLAIIIIVLIDFKSPRYALLSATPLFAGIIWLLEIMGLTGIQFNLANFFAIPILIGVGIDNGVQIVHRYLQGGGDIKVMAKSTGAAALLTSLTTGISFGMLILSKHRGIQSLGLIMTLGALTCLIGSLILLPSVLKVLPRAKVQGTRHKP